MNVYNRATGWGTLITLILLAGVLVVDIWLMEKLPILRHGLGYVVLQGIMAWVFLKLIRLMFRDGPPSVKN